jgi:hypothetical protein
MNKPESSPAPIIEALISKAKASGHPDHGFSAGAAGVKEWEKYAPTQVTSSSQLNQPLGQARADEIATYLKLEKSLCLTSEQYATFVSGNSMDGSANAAYARLIIASVASFTNSKANPCICDINGQRTEIVLGSYGLTVNAYGLLESLANVNAPTRQVNEVLQPGGYLAEWAKANDAEQTQKMLDESHYTRQLPHGIAAQHEGTGAGLALYLNGAESAVVGLSMVPSLWEINFCLIYALNPTLAAGMPAYWTPIPPNVVEALEKSALETHGIDFVNIPGQISGGQVPFSDYASEFNYSPD